ncbi:metal ABC transporter ATP-binding protein [Formivibrio citricus]|nr:metal ABC transporter ATP-binding protein [Formivibrio citricus]
MIQLSNLTVCYQQRPAIHHISGRFERGSHTAIVGPNGAGKSTLLKAIAGLLPATGKIVANEAIGYLPQLAEIDRHFPLTVAELALSGHWLRAGNAGQLDATASARALAALERMGLADFAARSVATLSGGQMQRVRFARLIVQDTPIMLLDEPFNSVDSRTAGILIEVLAEWHAAGKTLVTVVHDLGVARAHFPQALLLAREVVAWGPSDEALQADNLERAQKLIEHWHNEAEWCAVP